VILGNLDLVNKQASDSSPRIQRQLAAVRHAAERGSGLTRQLLAFSRRQRLSPDVLDIAALVRGFEPLLKRAVGETIALEVDVPEAPVVCEVDPTQLETALLNLSVNARDAMPKGGRLSISIQAIDRADELRAAAAEAPLGPWHVVTVRDTGTGMPRAVTERAFEPFFTTKEIGKGSGLGLSQVYGFVRQSGGFVTLTSEVGQGSEVSMYLRPSSEPIAEHHVQSEPAELRRGRGESILLVEDDPSVLALGIEMLTELGYNVLTASDAAGALEILKRGDQIDLVFTDVVMPGGRTGVQLASEARELRPGIKILLTSGYTGEALERHQTETIPLIEKPFRQDDLAAKIRDILNEPGGSVQAQRPQPRP
jgi:CheY-like chemotaxis protein